MVLSVLFGMIVQLFVKRCINQERKKLLIPTSKKSLSLRVKRRMLENGCQKQQLYCIWRILISYWLKKYKNYNVYFALRKRKSIIIKHCIKYCQLFLTLAIAYDTLFYLFNHYFYFTSQTNESAVIRLAFFLISLGILLEILFNISGRCDGILLMQSSTTIPYHIYSQ